MQKAYLKDPQLAKNSAFHRAYVGNGAVTEDGKPGPLYVMEFEHGVAKNVDEQIFQRFKDAGVASEKRPTLPHSDD